MASTLGPFKKGDSATIRYTVRDGTGALQNITGWAFEFFVTHSGTPPWIIDKMSSDSAQIRPFDAPNGVVDVFIAPGDTVSMGTQVKYRFKFRGTDPSGNQYTLDTGLFEVSEYS